MGTSLTLIEEIHHNLTRVAEHGQEWLHCNGCGAQWSIEDSNEGEDFERVTEGDESCFDFAELST